MGEVVSIGLMVVAKARAEAVADRAAALLFGVERAGSGGGT